MVKFFLLLVIIQFVFAKNIFDTNCLSCHRSKELKLFMIKYTLKYSSEKKITKQLFNFLRAPSSNKSIMPYEYIKQHGFKNESKLSNTKLKQAIKLYFKKYNLKNFIR